MAVSKRGFGGKGNVVACEKRVGTGRQMSSRDRPKARRAVITADLSRNWVFQLEPGYMPSGDLQCQTPMSVWLQSLVPVLPSPCQGPGCGVYTECSCHANWICQEEG